MEYRRLGTSGLRVSPICMGAMMFGDRTAEKASLGIIHEARDRGFNFIDTADRYTFGRSEEIVGKAIRRHRDHWVVATKAGATMGPNANATGLGRGWLMHSIDASLKRLGTDYADIYYLHVEDNGTPLTETIGAIGDIIRAGKVRYWGFSNFRAWKIADMVHIADQLGVPRPVVSQPYYNAVNRMPEVEYLPACGHFGIGAVPYSPLARGILTGKYVADGKPPKGSRGARGDRRMMQTEYRKESMVIAGKFVARAEKRGMTPGQFAVNWVLANTLITSVLVGPRTLAQWREYVGALDHTFAAADEAFVDKLVAPGHPSTPGYTDPTHPVAAGRPAGA
jgi:aryl-alcohol dehydrogenase-like predicted oxidoreductase